MEVSLSGPLRQAADGLASIELEASTIRELIERLLVKYPRMNDHMVDGIAVSIDGTIYRDNWDVPIPQDSEVYLLPRIVGG